MWAVCVHWQQGEQGIWWKGSIMWSDINVCVPLYWCGSAHIQRRQYSVYNLFWHYKKKHLFAAGWHTGEEEVCVTHSWGIGILTISHCARSEMKSKQREDETRDTRTRKQSLHWKMRGGDFRGNSLAGRQTFLSAMHSSRGRASERRRRKFLRALLGVRAAWRRRSIIIWQFVLGVIF